MEINRGLFEDTELDTIGGLNGTDKASNGHDYLRKYEFFFKPWKEDTFTFLELGINTGASIKTWKEYFLNIKIIAVDINPETRAAVGNDAHVIIGDMGSLDLLQNLHAYKPRIIVDDASHLWWHQLQAFFILFPCLESGGIYILEDICTSFEPWASNYGKQVLNKEEYSPFRVMQRLAEYLTVNEKTQAGERVQPISRHGPFQEEIELISKAVDAVIFIKFTCIIIKKHKINLSTNTLDVPDLKALENRFLIPTTTLYEKIVFFIRRRLRRLSTSARKRIQKIRQNMIGIFGKA